MWAKFFLISVTAMLPVAAVAQEPTPKPTKVKKICVTPESALGSRIPPRPVCRTKSEWADVNRRASVDIDEVSRDIEARAVINTDPKPVDGPLRQR